MIYNIQILRAIAAIIVIAFHTVLAAENYNFNTNLFSHITIWGASGVDIFFVISGFIMIYIQNKKKKTPLEFWKDRIERIVPLYWALIFLITFLLLIFPQGFNDLKINSEIFLRSITFTSYISENIPILYVGWTLEYEMLFYFIFGLSLFIKNQNISFVVCIAILCILVLNGLNSIIIEFVYGMIIGYFYNKYKISIKSIYSLIIIILGFSLLTIEWSKEIPRNVSWGLPAAMIFIGALYLKPIKSKIGEILGTASYAMYLVQAFSIPAYYKVISSISFLRNPSFSEFYFVLCILVTVVAGLILHMFIEKPLANIIIKFKNRKANTKQLTLEAET